MHYDAFFASGQKDREASRAPGRHRDGRPKTPGPLATPHAGHIFCVARMSTQLHSDRNSALLSKLRRRTSDRADKGRVFAAGGEMGALMRSIDWSATPLGPVEDWSLALRTAVGLLLRNRSPMLLWWGPRFIQLYNDAYGAIAGDKHPR